MRIAERPTFGLGVVAVASYAVMLAPDRTATPPRPVVERPAPRVLTATRLGCCGPRYQLAIAEDGEVDWLGFAGVAATGPRHARLPKRVFEKLARELERAKLPAGSADCARGAVETAIELGAVRVIDRCGTDQELIELEESIVLQTGAARWIDGPDAVVIALEHEGGGLGSTRFPSYRLTVRGDGTVVWRGRRDVAAIGVRVAWIPVRKVAALVDELDAHQFFELDDSGRIQDPELGYGTSCSDSPWTGLVVTRRGASHEIDDGHCNHTVLDDLEDRIVAVAGAQAWIDGPPVRVRDADTAAIGRRRASLAAGYAGLALGAQTGPPAWRMIEDAATGRPVYAELVTDDAGLLDGLRLWLGDCATTRARLVARWGPPDAGHDHAWTGGRIRASFNESVCTLAFERVP